MINKKKIFINLIAVISLLLLFSMLYTCGNSSSDPVPPGSGGGGIIVGGGGTTVTVGSVTVTANPSSVTINGTSSVTATVLDTTGANIPDGTLVSFTLSNSSLGSITSTASVSNGVATATFTAQDTAGVVTVTASAGGVTGTVDITILGAQSGSISFVSATPTNIGIKGSGQQETSVVVFSVLDETGGPVADGVGVDFCLIGPTGGRLPQDGGEYINELENLEETYTDANGNGCYDTGETYTDSNADSAYNSPLHAAVSTSNGEATVILHSGTVAGNVTIIATITGTGLASATPVISIGGGIPSATHFSVARDIVNLPGLEFVNRQATISVFLADRFGNGNVLEGTTVSFYAESGATVTSSATLDSSGATSVTFRTQAPDPYDVAPEVWETNLQTDVLTRYDPFGDGITPPPGHPRDGWGAVMVAVDGEEHFDDLDGNGMFDWTDADSDGIQDPLENDDPFTDTAHEPYIDFNDNGTYDDGTGADPAEIYVDDDGDGGFDGANGIWDSSKTIFVNALMLITGSPTYILFSSGAAPVPAIFPQFTIADGGSQTFDILISDENLNYLSSGTSVQITADGGKLSGFTDYDFPDFFSTGPYETTVTLADASAGDTDAPQVVTLQVEVVWEGITYIDYITGTVD